MSALSSSPAYLAGSCSTFPHLCHSRALCHTVRRCPNYSRSSDFRCGRSYRRSCSEQQGWNSSKLHTEYKRSGYYCTSEGIRSEHTPSSAHNYYGANSQQRSLYHQSYIRRATL